MIKRYFFMLPLLAVVLMCSGCLTRAVIGGGNAYPPQAYPEVKKKAPPPWAPAHGHRAKYVYRYYPSSSIYFDTGRGLYFYLRGGAWTASASLPGGITISVNDFVTLEMDNDRPYAYHSDVKKRYPPGKLKKMNKPATKKKRNKKNWD